MKPAASAATPQNFPLLFRIWLQAQGQKYEIRFHPSFALRCMDHHPTNPAGCIAFHRLQLRIWPEFQSLLLHPLDQKRPCLVIRNHRQRTLARDDDRAPAGRVEETAVLNGRLSAAHDHRGGGRIPIQRVHQARVVEDAVQRMSFNISASAAGAGRENEMPCPVGAAGYRDAVRIHNPGGRAEDKFQIELLLALKIHERVRTGCLADNAVVAEAHIYDHLVRLLAERGGYLCDEDEKARLQSLMWPQAGAAVPSVAVIAKSSRQIAEMAGIPATENHRFLIVEEHGTGPDYPFSGEKLSVVVALYRYQGAIENAAKLVNSITDYQGRGHTCGIHTRNDAHVMALALGTKTARVMVNRNLNEGAGSARNGLPYTLSLSCGTWGGNITTENVNARHLVNLTWVLRPISEEALFREHWDEFGK